MKAYTLNGSVNAGPETTLEIPVDGGTVVMGPPVFEPEGFKLETAKKYWESGKALFDSGQADGSGINYAGLLSAVASGAAAGTAIPGLGTIAGGVIAAGIWLVGFFTSSTPSRWDTAGPGVHYWFTNFGPQEYLDYIDATGNTGVFASVDKCVEGLIVFWLNKYSYVLWDDARFYNNIPDATYYTQMGGTQPGWNRARAIYASMGVDWTATIAKWRADGQGGLMMIAREKIADGADDEAPTTDPRETASSDTLLIVLAGAAIVGGALYVANQNGGNAAR